MAEALILDAEALNALARPSSRGALTSRASAILQVAHERCALVRVPAPVLTEVCRGAQYDAPIHRLLNRPGIGVVDLSRGVAERAGHLLARVKLATQNPMDLDYRALSNAGPLVPRSPANRCRSRPRPRWPAWRNPRGSAHAQRAQGGAGVEGEGGRGMIVRENPLTDRASGRPPGRVCQKSCVS